MCTGLKLFSLLLFHQLEDSNFDQLGEKEMLVKLCNICVTSLMIFNRKYNHLWEVEAHTCMFMEKVCDKTCSFQGQV